MLVNVRVVLVRDMNWMQFWNCRFKCNFKIWSCRSAWECGLTFSPLSPGPHRYLSCRVWYIDGSDKRTTRQLPRPLPTIRCRENLRRPTIRRRLTNEGLSEFQINLHFPMFSAPRRADERRGQHGEEIKKKKRVAQPIGYGYGKTFALRQSLTSKNYNAPSAIAAILDQHPTGRAQNRAVGASQRNSRNVLEVLCNVSNPI